MNPCRARFLPIADDRTKVTGLAKILEETLSTSVAVHADDRDNHFGRAEIQAKICVNLRHALLFREVTYSLAT
jgi:hypothetical protein